MKNVKLSLIAVAVIGLNGCFLKGDDGSNGIEGAAGQTGVDGQNGTPGTQGTNSLVMQTNLAVGNANCPNSGVQFDSGIDTDVSGSLETSEITSTNYICAPGLASVSSTQLLSSLNNDWYIEAAALVSRNKNTWLNATGGISEQSNSPSQQQVTSYETNSPAQQATLIQQLKGSAKNVILFVGDGMGVSTVTASRILEGQLNGQLGEENNLSFDLFPFSGLAKTYNVDAQTPDSAGTMTSISGIKAICYFSLQLAFRVVDDFCEDDLAVFAHRKGFSV